MVMNMKPHYEPNGANKTLPDHIFGMLKSAEGSMNISIHLLHKVGGRTVDGELTSMVRVAEKTPYDAITIKYPVVPDGTVPTFRAAVTEIASLDVFDGEKYRRIYTRA